MESVRQLAAQEASITALRTSVFLIGVLSAFAWSRRRHSLALGAAATSGLLALGYWLVQIVSPLGFDTDRSLTRAWAHAGVNALAQPAGSGFVWGTDPEISLVSTLALAGMPLELIARAPQAASVLALGLLIALPFFLLKNRLTVRFAAVLGLSGGLWPGPTPYAEILSSPASLVHGAALLGLLVLLLRARRARRILGRFRPGLGALLIAAATLARAGSGGVEPGAAASLFLSGAAILLASPLRVALRKVSGSAAGARRAEALWILCAFGGSGLTWWDPPSHVAGFNEARNANAALLKPMDWIRRNVPTTSVVLTSPEYSAPIAAFAGRRVLFPPPGDEGSGIPEPFRRARLSESTRQGQPIARLAEAFSVTHVFLGPGEASPPVGVDLGTSNEPRMKLELVYEDARDFRVFRLVKK